MKNDGLELCLGSSNNPLETHRKIFKLGVRKCGNFDTKSAILNLIVLEINV